jgi:uncharacterized protein (TIGR00299 family) protein
MAKTAYLDCFSGISGDMTIGAFLDAGLGMKDLARSLGKLGLKGYELRAKKVMRGAIRGTKFDCVTKKAAHDHKPLKSILSLIDKSALNKKVKDMAKAIFLALGGAEAKVHGAGSVFDARLHELGETDSIIDIVGTAIALDLLDIEEVYSSAITMGRTVMPTKGGILPMPGPASLELLKDAPMRISNVDAELVTPTGAAILKVIAKGFGEMPQLKLTGVGYGAGQTDLGEVPNILRVLIGERAGAFAEDRVFVVETSIDDMNPQNFEYLFERLFREGALDVYVENIQMKKSRPAFKLTVLVEPPLLKKIAAVIFAETTTIGLRFREEARFKLKRTIVRVNTRYGSVNVKVSKGPDDIITISPEYEECAKMAFRKRIPLKAVYEEAKRLVKI